MLRPLSEGNLDQRRRFDAHLQQVGQHSADLLKRSVRLLLGQEQHFLDAGADALQSLFQFAQHQGALRGGAQLLAPSCQFLLANGQLLAAIGELMPRVADVAIVNFNAVEQLFAHEPQLVDLGRHAASTGIEFGKPRLARLPPLFAVGQLCIECLDLVRQCRGSAHFFQLRAAALFVLGANLVNLGRQRRECPLFISQSRGKLALSSLGLYDRILRGGQVVVQVAGADAHGRQLASKAPGVFVQLAHSCSLGIDCGLESGDALAILRDPDFAGPDQIVHSCKLHVQLRSFCFRSFGRSNGRDDLVVESRQFRLPRWSAAPSVAANRPSRPACAAPAGVRVFLIAAGLAGLQPHCSQAVLDLVDDVATAAAGSDRRAPAAAASRSSWP